MKLMVWRLSVKEANIKTLLKISLDFQIYDMLLNVVTKMKSLQFQ
jgi:hypothetical protein